ncbi:MAG TPA: NifB/NifX family molybdenum-iron cluster-binding protein [Sunxiuqinia sp.]|nr:NifB/NifX family molybdenum-iron cluster-binding protein [Sunxiuqinia sp.]
MKVAITSTGNKLSSILDNRFGRCSYFAIYDMDTNRTKFIKNPNTKAQTAAGEAAAHLVASQGVTQLVSGQLGIKVKPLLKGLKIQTILFSGPEMTIDEILTLMAIK